MVSSTRAYPRRTPAMQRGWFQALQALRRRRPSCLGERFVVARDEEVVCSIPTGGSARTTSDLRKCGPVRFNARCVRSHLLFVGLRGGTRPHRRRPFCDCMRCRNRLCVHVLHVRLSNGEKVGNALPTFVGSAYWTAAGTQRAELGNQKRRGVRRPDRPLHVYAKDVAPRASRPPSHPRAETCTGGPACYARTTLTRHGPWCSILEV